MKKVLFWVLYIPSAVLIFISSILAGVITASNVEFNRVLDKFEEWAHKDK